MARTDAHSLDDAKDADRGALGERTAHPGSAALQEKAAIDAGLTGDKIAHNDITTNPLGTDDEAGGGRPQPVEFPARTPLEGKSNARDPNRANELSPPVPWIWLLVALLVAGLIGVALWGALSPD
jgi:hypothetical protein